MLRTPYRDGTIQKAFEPGDFIARLAALVPKPRVNSTRYQDVLAPNHRWRGLVTLAKRCGMVLDCKKYCRGLTSSPETSVSERMAWVPAYSRSGMSRYELYYHRRKTVFRYLGGHFANFSSSFIKIIEETFSKFVFHMLSED